MIKNGCIPKNITIFSNGKSKSFRWWEDLDDEDTSLLVTRAFVVDSSSTSMLKTARRWAEDLSEYDQEKRTYIKKNELKVDEIENKPIAGIKVIGLEHRGNGGRAYKIVTRDNYYFDLREDVLLDTIINEGILKGGELGGSFVWGKIGSQMKLIRVGSKLYNELNETGERISLKKVGAKELKVGGVYESKTGEKGIFLGWISTVEVIANKSTNRTDLRYYYTYSFTTKRVNKAMLWLKIWGFNNKTPIDEFSEWLGEKNSPYRARIKTSHSFVRELDSINLPANIIELTKNMAIDYALNSTDKMRSDSNEKMAIMSYHSDLINMSAYGKTLQIHPIFDNLHIQL